MILQLWEGKVPLDIQGRFWNVKMKDHLHPEFGVGHLHLPYQLPHPPIYVPSISRNSPGLTRAAERGFRFGDRGGSHVSSFASSSPASSSGRRTGVAAPTPA